MVEFVETIFDDGYCSMQNMNKKITTENCVFYSLINFLCPILLFEKLIGSLVKIRKRTWIKLFGTKILIKSV